MALPETAFGNAKLATITAIEISVETIQRDHQTFVIRNLTRGHAEWDWMVSDAETGETVALSQDQSPSLALPVGSYDVLVTAKGTNSLLRHFRRLITVLPNTFSEEEADEVIDLSSIRDESYVKDYRNELRPGYKIILKGTYYGRIKISGLRGTPDKPVHIINKGQVEIHARNSRYPFALLWGDGNHHILIDGKADPDFRYGIKLIGHREKSGQIVFVAGEFNKGFEMTGLHIIGQYGQTSDGAAIQIQTSYSEDCNANNWNFGYVKIHHNKIEQASSEGMYLGYFTDEKRDSGFAPHRLGRVLVYRDTVLNSGWDAIQIASADEFEVHDNYVDGASLAGKRSHSSFLSWNNGNRAGYCYRNTFRNGAHAATIMFGETGREAYLYSNLFVEGRYPSSINTPGFIFSKVYNRHRQVGLYIFHNTLITSRISAKVDYRNTRGNKPIPVIYAGNAILQNRLNLNGFSEIAMGNHLEDSPGWVIDNVWRMRSRAKELRWSGNYKPMAGSPLSRISFDITKHISKLKGGFYDRDGYPLKHEKIGYTSGCFSAHHMTIDDETVLSHGIH